MESCHTTRSDRWQTQLVFLTFATRKWASFMMSAMTVMADPNQVYLVLLNYQIITKLPNNYQIIIWYCLIVKLLIYISDNICSLSPDPRIFWQNNSQNSRLSVRTTYNHQVTLTPQRQGLLWTFLAFSSGAISFGLKR